MGVFGFLVLEKVAMVWRRGRMLLCTYTLQWLPSKEEKCNFLAISLSLSLPDFNCLSAQKTLAALQIDELPS